LEKNSSSASQNFNLFFQILQFFQFQFNFNFSNNRKSCVLILFEQNYQVLNTFSSHYITKKMKEIEGKGEMRTENFRTAVMPFSV